MLQAMEPVFLLLYSFNKSHLEPRKPGMGLHKKIQACDPGENKLGGQNNE